MKTTLKELEKIITIASVKASLIKKIDERVTRLNHHINYLSMRIDAHEKEAEIKQFETISDTLISVCALIQNEEIV